ncbi:ephexin-1 [Trichomycterus rosablanca]|uniref:ephexin-1 n=1 Tax=Trichomycterus rosablanca TaxID=2290929 RepID=UPI002F358AE4
MATSKPRITQKPNLPPKPNTPMTPNTPPTPHRLNTAHTLNTPPTIHQPKTTNTQHAPHTKSGTGEDGLIPSLGELKTQQKLTHPSKENKGKKLQMDAGRSEPDGSEMAECVKAEQNLMVPPPSLEEKHCHCICHLHKPGMKLVWVPLEEKDRSNMEQLTVQMGESSSCRTSMKLEHSTNNHTTSTHNANRGTPTTPSVTERSHTKPQCYSCRSFRLHHSQQDVALNENMYESMELFFSFPPEEPLYLELQPSDPPLSSPTPPKPPPRPPATLRSRHKERRNTQPVLAYMLSPRGGRPPIRTHSSCGTESGITAPAKLKTEKRRDLKQSGAQDETHDKQEKVMCSSEAEVHSDNVHDDYEVLQCMSDTPRRKCISECVMDGEVKLWQHLSMVKESGMLNNLPNVQIQRQESMFEVVTTEASFLRSLNVLRDHFLGSRELDDTLVLHDRKSLFSNIMQVHEVSQRFLEDLLKRVDESVLISSVCDIIYHHATTHFSVYVEYVRNQVYQEQTYSRLMQCNRVFHTVMRRLEESPLCNRLPFTSFMLLPFQRITRIKILIQSILKNTPEGSTEENTAYRALATINEIIKQANTQVGQMKQMEELINIANILEFDKLKAIPLVSQQRWLEKQGELEELSKGGSLFSFRLRFNPVYIFLFNDLLILTRRSSVNPDRFQVLDHAHRTLVQVQPMDGGVQLGHAFCLTMLENHQGTMCERIMKANTESDLHRWVAALPVLSASPEIKEEKVYEDWDCPQVQCVQQYVAKQTDELGMEPSDIINVIRKTSEGWWQGIRLSDRMTGWFPHDVVVEITNEHQRRRHLREQYHISQTTDHSDEC